MFLDTKKSVTALVVSWSYQGWLTKAAFEISWKLFEALFIDVSLPIVSDSEHVHCGGVTYTSKDAMILSELQAADTWQVFVVQGVIELWVTSNTIFPRMCNKNGGMATKSWSKYLWPGLALKSLRHWQSFEDFSLQEYTAILQLLWVQVRWVLQWSSGLYRNVILLQRHAHGNVYMQSNYHRTHTLIVELLYTMHIISMECPDHDLSPSVSAGQFLHTTSPRSTGSW